MLASSDRSHPWPQTSLLDGGVRPHVAAYALRVSLLEVAVEGHVRNEPSGTSLLRDGLANFNGILACRVQGN